MTVRRTLLLLAVTAGLLTGCAGQSPPPHDPPAGPHLPSTGGHLDYQLGGAYDLPDGVEIVVRDRAAASVDDLYSVCYVNGFQTQPGELDAWPDDLLLRDDDGEPVIDPDWPDEVILDTRQADEIAKIVGPWIRDCASDGFDAVEFDNLDTYTRTDGALTRDDALDLATLLVDTAHDVGLAAGQKNAAEDASLLHSRAGFDFAVVEECAAYDECSAYTEVYGDHVLAIEYTDNLPRQWDEVCADPETPTSVVLRDRDLVTSDDPAYVFETCE
ncbi:endo alpha-1,4 polygalactosaminidase [Microbacterium sp. CnD16-F]|uniref:endo alpha-1,4 polygalactosaminidase n=1 Tax=Microbacterium sp. CnD16-F TaxID=2954493 RepID=UPI00209743C2|nr:endo alpha-1,4 polygalactosaminidase [Microbacterium sp. CnD16-F]MCO7202146.1 endo alpha-1,4 polygalactosaminidase [Microbacterium sp. CnD16-F]